MTQQPPVTQLLTTLTPHTTEEVGSGAVRLDKSAGAIALMKNADETTPILFQAMWSEEDPQSPNGDRKVCTFLVSETSTKLKTQVTRNKRAGKSFFEDRTPRITTFLNRPLIPKRLVRALDSMGRQQKSFYLVRLGDEEMHLPFGISRKQIVEVQERLTKSTCSISEKQTEELLTTLARVCDPGFIARGQEYQRAFNNQNPETSISDQAGDLLMPSGLDMRGLSAEGVVLIPESVDGGHGAPLPGYAYLDTGWNPRFKEMADEETGGISWKRDGLVHILPGHPLHVGKALYRDTNAGSFVHLGEKSTLAGWRKVVDSVTARSPLTGAMMVQAAGSMGRGLLNVETDVSGLIYIHGPTSRGKSFLMKVVASMFGFPSMGDTSEPSMIISANQTDANFDRICQMVRHGFLSIDEIQEAKNDIAAFLMRLANSRPRGRTVEAGTATQSQQTWNLTLMISGNDPIEKLLNEKGGNALEFLNAIMARLLTVDITKFPVFPGSENDEDAARTKMENGQAIVGLNLHHGVAYAPMTDWLAKNADFCAEVFVKGEADYLARFPSSRYGGAMHRSSKNHAYQCVGYEVFKGALGYTEEDLAPFRAAWDAALEANASFSRVETVDNNLEAEVTDLIHSLERAKLLYVKGHWCETEEAGLNGATQQAAAKHRQPTEWLAYLDEPLALTGPSDFSGKLMLRPSGSAIWSTLNRNVTDLKKKFESVTRQIELQDNNNLNSEPMMTPSKEGRGPRVVVRKIVGRAERVHEINLSRVRGMVQSEPDPQEPPPMSPEDAAALDRLVGAKS